jgi:DNA-directed RNA polymerase
MQHNLERRQLELEEESRLNGGKRETDRVIKHAEKKSESLTPYGKRITSATVKEVATGITDRLSVVQSGPKLISDELLKKIDPLVASTITIRFIIDAISTKDRKFTATAIALGGKIEDEIWSTGMYDKEPYLIDKVLKDIDSRSVHYGYKKYKLSQQKDKVNFQWTPWTTREKLHVGEALFQVFIEKTGLVSIKAKPHRGKTYNVIVCEPKTLEWINNSKKFNEFLNPEHFPMIVEPTDWTNPFNGGYRNTKGIYLVKGHRITSHMNYLEELKQYDMPEVYNSINDLQKTRWKVNRNILLVLNTCYNYGNRSRGKLINNELLDLPPKPHDIATNKVALKKWKAKAVAVYTANERTKSKRLGLAKTIHLANKFEKEDGIYFVWTLDFRGRAYPVPPYLNPQGPDFAKALLLFADGLPLGKDGVRYLAIHIANLYGQDKLSLDERVKWTFDNSEIIKKCGDEPFKHNFWEDAEEPFQFLAACIEWAGYLKHGEKFVSHLPLHSDGSCNGLQHFSAMLRDEVGGEAVNLLPTDRPKDIYGMVSKVVEDKLEKDESEKKWIASEWNEYGIDRKACKRSVMTLPYGSTRYSATEFVDEYIQKRLDNKEDLQFQNRQQAAIYLAGNIWDSIGEVVVKAPEAMEWLQKVARLCAEQKTPVFWVTPLGFPVRQAYYSQAETVLKTRMMGRIRIRSTTNKVDKRRQANGISPNFVHSLDATVMLLTVAYAKQKGIVDFAMVHDSFGTLAANQKKLNDCLRQAFVDMYTQIDPLEVFLQHAHALIPEKLHHKIPELPKKGKLDINKVLEADYFFS